MHDAFLLAPWLYPALTGLAVLTGCIDAIAEQLEDGQRRIVSFFPQVHVRNLADEFWQNVDPQGLSFRNINTPEEYFRLRGEPSDLRLATKEEQEQQA